MERFRRWRVPQVLLCLALLSPAWPLPARAQEGAAASQGVDATLEEAKELIKDGDYDRAIEILKNAILQTRGQLAHLREAYLLLIKTYVFLGNDLKFRPQGREASNLNYKAARELITECLQTKELRHTRPEPASEYPPEMVSLFAEVRSQIFGSFRVAELQPSDAVVILGADTLRALPGDTLLGDVDLAVGRHLVVVRSHGYKDLTDEIVISPNSTLEGSYELQKRRTGWWYATRSVGAVGALALVVGFLSGGSSDGGSPSAQPLPTPPAVPAK